MTQVIEVFVKHGTSAPFTIQIEEDSVLLNLMEKISEKTSIPVEKQKLILRGKTLSAQDVTLSSAGIKNKTRLLLIGTIEMEEPEEPVAPKSTHSIPTPICDWISRPPRFVRNEYLTAPPHSIVISKGPPDGALEGSNHQLQSLPVDPLIIRDSSGDEARLMFNTDEVFISSEKTEDRLFYDEISSFGIQAIPGYEQKYIAIVFHLKGKKTWIYFIPKQFRTVIESILQKRR